MSTVRSGVHHRCFQVIVSIRLTMLERNHRSVIALTTEKCHMHEVTSSCPKDIPRWDKIEIKEIFFISLLFLCLIIIITIMMSLDCVQRKEERRINSSKPLFLALFSSSSSSPSSDNVQTEMEKVSDEMLFKVSPSRSLIIAFCSLLKFQLSCFLLQEDNNNSVR